MFENILPFPRSQNRNQLDPVKALQSLLGQRAWLTVNVKTSGIGDRSKDDGRDEAKDSDREFEQVPRDMAECLKVMNSSRDARAALPLPVL